MTRRLVIGIAGLAGSGKSTAARILSRQHGFVRRPMAYPLKSMIAALGFEREVLDGPASAKELPLEILGGKSLRHAMQTLGTEWGRTCMDEDFWVRMWLRGLDGIGDVVCDDVRFANEAQAIRDLGGVIVRLVRSGAGTPVNPGHASERVDALPHDVIIPNTGTEEDLARSLGRVIDQMRHDTWARAVRESA